MHYTPAVPSKGIRALSSGTDAILAAGDEGTIMRHQIGTKAWSWTAGGLSHASPRRGVAQQLDEAVAVGNDGVILELGGGKVDRLHRHPRNGTLRAVVYTSWHGALAVGDGGTIVRRTAPREPRVIEPSPTPNDLHGACAGLRDVWVVGAAGTIALRDPTGWKTFPSITSATLPPELRATTTLQSRLVTRA